MKEIKLFCDKCKIKLFQHDLYYIVEMRSHLPNVSYSGDIKEKHLCNECIKGSF